ncbi:hypothetical protein CEY11_01200 [Candidimonas nitroreducens]|uniref:ABC transporter substrate-binding protein n=2 Tax=Candidimonas nitroreducens TaxID=683354 RepID=A0A225N5U8_9BURK|nr:hypothetical protein CEY11_01200 [Candidimonas nitroreducens]
MQSNFLRCVFLAILLFAGTAASAAESYPDRPIRLYVGFPPGGPTDIIARIIGRGLSEKLGQSVVVENRGGAGGMIAARAVASAKPDGYTLFVSVESSQTRGAALHKSLSYDPVKDFTYIAKIAKQRNLLVVNPRFPASNVAEFLAYLKANPGKVNFGGTFGATSHIGGILFDLENKTRMSFISYQGGAQPITDLMAGVTQVGFFTEATIASAVKAGKLKPLAVCAPERSPEFPNLPTIGEAGAHPMELSPWFGLAGPAHLPPAIVSRLEHAVEQLVSDKTFNTQLQQIGAVSIVGSNAKSNQSDVVREIAYWKKFVADAKIPINP